MDFLWKFLANKVKDYVLRNWKTTLLGVIGGVLVKYIPDPETRQAVLAGIVAAIGIFAKDGDQTGTTASLESAKATQRILNGVKGGAVPVPGGLPPAQWGGNVETRTQAEMDRDYGSGG